MRQAIAWWLADAAKWMGHKTEMCQKVFLGRKSLLVMKYFV
jgi:hypothetical protein